MASFPPVFNLSGRLGHLNEAQSTAFDQFKQRLEEAGYYTPAGEDGEKEASHSDATLVRFLRARKFQVDGAYDQFVASENWRKDDKVNELYENFDVDEFVASQLVYSLWTGRRTISGQPLSVYNLNDLTKERINEYSKKADRLAPRMTALSEILTEFVVPLCEALPRDHLEIPIDATTTIESLFVPISPVVDISNVSLAKFWSLRNHMIRASGLQTANYPEMLGQTYIVGAPGFFSTVWGWIQKGFDQGTVEKVRYSCGGCQSTFAALTRTLRPATQMHILSESEVFPTLSRYILPENIPKRYGGTLEFEYNNRPNLDAEALALLGLDKSEDFPRGPLRFSGKDGLTLLGSGRREGEGEGMQGRGKGKGVHFMKEPKGEEGGAVETNGAAQPNGSAPPALEAAKEVPGAPIKDLAAALEGTTL
ncbi:BZ3500_MvSof-1268-A1-R1_Chr10-1g02579 [Microbotryum saponariae]|uniref:BZ3500_MvSof-1268-A1-R1_Chr10-1g02579 protein n=1 Tax=Microbotryum saponariae TaxID=289078 RepID=A0A2X0L8G6_9BASI|nr:BZ3500_MvSof-1268-A1-R1_Chr10-1g02579 [Microbotryum saponariae]SDA06068.1 BZ3501_MvSof-1269-A2-R1_Chr10-1g02180 [Microbotryum saponariae]